jgi:hypothetical protein
VSSESSNHPLLADLEIHLQERSEVQLWAHHFNVPIERVRQAILTVGPKVINVRRYLNK